MKKSLLKIVIAAFLAGGWDFGSALQAQQPYVVLRQPRVDSRRHAAPRTWQRKTLPSPIYPVPAQAYAYGWFGAQPRAQWSRSFGYHRAYTQWTGR